jgi:rhamnogalacturonan hydrolase
LNDFADAKSTGDGNMFMFKHLEDFEFYSSTSKGAIQGYGYEFHKSK